jgi:hypothetical protein
LENKSSPQSPQIFSLLSPQFFHFFIISEIHFSPQIFYHLKFYHLFSFFLSLFHFKKEENRIGVEEQDITENRLIHYFLIFISKKTYLAYNKNAKQFYYNMGNGSGGN